MSTVKFSKMAVKKKPLESHFFHLFIAVTLFLKNLQSLASVWEYMKQFHLHFFLPGSIATIFDEDINKLREVSIIFKPIVYPILSYPILLLYIFENLFVCLCLCVCMSECLIIWVERNCK